MRGDEEALKTYSKPDYEYGNHSPIEVIRILPYIGRTAIDPHASLEHEAGAQPLFTERQLATKVQEIVDNYQLINDPRAAELKPKHFGITIANKDRLDQGIAAILMMSTSGSSLFDERGNPNNEGNALELAYLAFHHPDKPIVYVESPGDGNSVDLEPEEYKAAAKDGKLIHETRDHTGRINGYEAFETLQALERALTKAGVKISHISSNATGAHFSTALLATSPRNMVERGFFYNPTNISDRNIVALTAATLKEILTQAKYDRVSKDPLKLTQERKEMARRIMGSVSKRKIDQARASTHNPVKLWRQQQIFRRGNRNGQSAAVQAVAAQLQHDELRQTYVFPEFAAHYKNPRDFHEFMRLVHQLGGSVVEMTDIESLKIPLGQYGHSHYPTAWHTLKGYAFNRE